jgi:hypothetical protein
MADYGGRRARAGSSSRGKRQAGFPLDRTIAGKDLPSEQLLAVRGVELLEKIGSLEARSFLKELAATTPESKLAGESLLSHEAKASLKRLAARPTTKP